MNILQNISFCVPLKKESHTTLEQNTVDCKNIKIYIRYILNGSKTWEYGL